MCHLGRPRPIPTRLCRPAPRPASYICPLLSTRQKAEAFNQPLSFDTSGVIIMHGMFFVRSPRSRARAPILAPCPPVCAGPHLAPRYINALFSTPQYAKAFNQSLSFDTSRITDMGSMFRVRSASYARPQP